MEVYYGAWRRRREWKDIYCLLKKKPQAQNGITYAKAHDAKFRFNTWLIAISTIPRNIILIN